ncbi:hypothetical protein BKA04_000785 [Cryobacterium mesophilum]|uniref:Septum formation n=1 Tax=Terrimesophilobacter mesophilus TaxID=433647 RepID=A0A4R8VB99_9MICO|nr:hypothetical protein [Terrimesophilobacter mesophilus]MBB5632562.1 hypothetical protein [Terrimesophilobacter mesophilus]TFB79380.1 hypothetical protein E3N84_04525 [Terrimesophilobacter mesophilus]
MGKRLFGVVSVMSIALLLSGCSLFNPGPARDSAGRVTESATISARDLTEGDCFTFNSADGGIVDQVTVMPCTLEHDYISIGQGTLTTAEVASAGSLQNAVSAACAPIFDTFKAAVKATAKPKQQFLVFPESDKADSDQLYSCISTDPDQTATASAPVEPSPSETTPAP